MNRKKFTFSFLVGVLIIFVVALAIFSGIGYIVNLVTLFLNQPLIFPYFLLNTSTVLICVLGTIGCVLCKKIGKIEEDEKGKKSN